MCVTVLVLEWGHARCFILFSNGIVSYEYLGVSMPEVNFFILMKTDKNV